MERSQINAIIREGIEFIRQCSFCLPPFAFWTPDDWKRKGHECDEIRNRMLGWDVADFGRGDFDRYGLLLFTLRNGDPRGPAGGKSYCEKALICRDNQRAVMHFHWQKMEDIINRAGADLVIQLYGSDENEEIERDRAVTVSVDGVETEVPAGGLLRLKPGQSVSLVQGLYHEIWGGGGTVLVGEVSAVNDDMADNRFAEPAGRFPEIEEDEPPLHYLCNEYPPAR